MGIGHRTDMAAFHSSRRLSMTNAWVLAIGIATSSAMPLLPSTSTSDRLSAELILTTFDGAPATTQQWRNVNDPVMGGQSDATLKISGGVATWDGETKIVPKLKAPGFCNLQTERASFADISTYDGIKLVLRSTMPYSGFKVSFGPSPHSSFFFASYKADFNVTASKDLQDIFIPFNSFSYKWSGTTGQPTTTCAADPSVCPDAKHLKALTSMEIAAEGVAGRFHLELKSISAVKISASAAQLPVGEATPSYPTIKELKTEQYLGRWYNLFANEYVARLFDGHKCCTGDYGVVSNRSDAISVYNAQQIDLIGTQFHTSGFATQSPNASEPGKFVVKQSVPFGIRPAPKEPPLYDTANYIIMELGPVVDGKYEYTLITGGKMELFVLARDKSRFVEKYQKDVLQKLASWGFTGKAVPYATSQDNCNYRPLPPALT